MWWNIFWFIVGSWFGFILLAIVKVGSEIKEINDEINEEYEQYLKETEEEEVTSDVDKHIPRLD